MDEMFKSAPWNKKLAILRGLKGWSQEEAGERMFTNKKGYWNWETGKSFPRKNSRISIAKAFGVDEKEIFGEQT